MCLDSKSIVRKGKSRHRHIKIRTQVCSVCLAVLKIYILLQCVLLKGYAIQELNQEGVVLDRVRIHQR